MRGAWRYWIATHPSSISGEDVRLSTILSLTILAALSSVGCVGPRSSPERQTGPVALSVQYGESGVAFESVENGERAGEGDARHDVSRPVELDAERAYGEGPIGEYREFAHYDREAGPLGADRNVSSGLVWEVPRVHVYVEAHEDYYWEPCDEGNLVQR